MLLFRSFRFLGVVLLRFKFYTNSAVEHGSEPLPGPAEFGLGICQREVHNLTNFFEVLFIQVKQGDDGAVVW